MIRIAHMGHVNAPMMLGALGVIEMGLIALDIPHGSGGTQKAIEYLGKLSKRDQFVSIFIHSLTTNLNT